MREPNEAGDENLSPADSLQWFKRLAQWVKDVSDVHETLRQIRQENAELRQQISTLQKAVDKQTGQLHYLDQLVQLRAKEEVERQLDRRARL